MYQDDYYRRRAARHAARATQGMMNGVGIGLLFFVIVAIVVAVWP